MGQFTLTPSEQEIQAFLKQYKKYFEMENVDLEFEKDAITEIAQLALKRKIGARGLRSIIESVMTDLMYEIPSKNNVKKVIITKEAVTDIILNVKEIVVEADEPGEKKMTLSVKGPAVITAADIHVEPGLRIINPEQVVATVTTDKEINMEFLVDSGEGFVVSDEIDTEGWPIGYLAVDAIYTPIKKVNYRVEDTMVGRVTNYDKLVLEISTDGSIEIQDALSYAVELLKIHVNPFTNIGNNMSKFRGSEDEAAATNTETENNIEDMKIEELDFTVRSYNCLKKAGVNTISDLTSMSYIELLKIKNSRIKLLINTI